MTNAEKFKTADERARAFDRWCHTRGGCDMCILHDAGIELSTCVCSFYWLDLEAEEEKPNPLLPCPYCGAETRVEEYTGVNHKPHYRVVCDDCYMQSCAGSRKDVVEKYNRVARAVMEAGKKEDGEK